MISETISYTLNCDEHGCNEYFDGEDNRPEYQVIDDAEEEGWTVDGKKCFCVEHNPTTIKPRKA